MKKRNKWDKYFLLNWKKVLLIILSWILAVVLHNLVYGLLKFYLNINIEDEPFFFILATIVIPVYALICFVYSFIKKLRNKSSSRFQFIIIILISIIFGILFAYLIVRFTFINPMIFWILFLIFFVLIYYLIKSFIKKK